MAMSTLQVRNVPEETHRAIRERAARCGMTVSEWVMTQIGESLKSPTPAEWVAMRRRLPIHPPIPVLEALHEGRGER